MPRAQKVQHIDFLHPDGWREVRIVWRLPDGSYKARLPFLNRRGERRAGYDWHHGKDAHRHYRDQGAPHAFRTVEQLLSDFARDVEQLRRKERA